MMLFEPLREVRGEITAQDYNLLVRRINQINRISVTGADVLPDATGWHLRVRGGGGNGTEVRRAYTQAAAGAGSTISCRLDNATTGESITVTCEIIGGTALNAAAPRLQSGDLLHVVYDEDNALWRSLFPFQTTSNCGCS